MEYPVTGVIRRFELHCDWLVWNTVPCHWQVWITLWFIGLECDWKAFGWRGILCGFVKCLVIGRYLICVEYLVVSWVENLVLSCLGNMLCLVGWGICCA